MSLKCNRMKFKQPLLIRRRQQQHDNGENVFTVYDRLKKKMMKMTTLMAIKAVAVARCVGKSTNDNDTIHERYTLSHSFYTRRLFMFYICIWLAGWLAGGYSMVWYWRIWLLYEKLLFHRHRHRHRRTHIVHVHKTHAKIETQQCWFTLPVWVEI